uniref:Uncharacterized protein n=1 Tax=Rhizophora mucronata TaxID=61149 RepID=A0A2P2J1L5_RHIMU
MLTSGLVWTIWADNDVVIWHHIYPNMLL